jgi:hypothetical protein
MAEDGAVTRERLPRQPVLPRHHIDFGIDMLQPKVLTVLQTYAGLSIPGCSFQEFVMIIVVANTHPCRVLRSPPACIIDRQSIDSKSHLEAADNHNVENLRRFAAFTRPAETSELKEGRSQPLFCMKALRLGQFGRAHGDRGALPIISVWTRNRRGSSVEGVPKAVGDG